MRIELECSVEQFKALMNDKVAVYDNIDNMPPMVLLTREAFVKLLNKVDYELKPAK